MMGGSIRAVSIAMKKPISVPKPRQPMNTPIAVSGSPAWFYVCPTGADLTTTGRVCDGTTFGCLASVSDCRPCPMKDRCCPKAPQRKILRSIHEAARDAARDIAETEAFEEKRRHRKKVEMAFAHLKRILRMGRPKITRANWCAG
jgi:hypothetical protein